LGAIKVTLAFEMTLGIPKHCGFNT